MRRERGIAPLRVRWRTMRRTAGVCTFALTAQMEKRQGRTLSSGVVAKQAARAGFEYALTRLTETDPKRRWLPDGRRYDWAFGDMSVRIEVVDESGKVDLNARSEEHTSELQSLMRISYAVFCLKKKNITKQSHSN